MAKSRKERFSINSEISGPPPPRWKVYVYISERRGARGAMDARRDQWVLLVERQRQGALHQYIEYIYVGTCGAERPEAQLQHLRSYRRGCSARTSSRARTYRRSARTTLNDDRTKRLRLERATTNEMLPADSNQLTREIIAAFCLHDVLSRPYRGAHVRDDAAFWFHFANAQCEALRGRIPLC